MGHRALLVYRREDRLCDLRYSHWGAKDLELATAVTEETPYANGSIDTSWLEKSVALDRVLVGFLDPCCYEALYVIATDFEVTPFRVWWIEWGEPGGRDRGAIVQTVPGAVDELKQTWFRATKTTLGDVVEMGGLSRRAAQAYLEARVVEDHDGYPYTYGGEEYTPVPDRWVDEDEW